MRQSLRTHNSKLLTQGHTMISARDHKLVPQYTRLKVRPRGTRYILHVEVNHFLLTLARPKQHIRDRTSQCSRLCVCSLDEVCRLLLTRNEQACAHWFLTETHQFLHTLSSFKGPCRESTRWNKTCVARFHVRRWSKHICFVHPPSASTSEQTARAFKDCFVRGNFQLSVPSIPYPQNGIPKDTVA